MPKRFFLFSVLLQIMGDLFADGATATPFDSLPDEVTLKIVKMAAALENGTKFNRLFGF